MSSEKVRWGILGTGMIAKKFAGDLPHSKSGELAATASRTQESADRFASEFGGRGVAGYQTLLDDPEIEAVYLALPNGLHREVTIAALRAGKHVLCEKPIARNETEADEMFAVAEQCGRVLIEAFMYRAHPLMQKLVETVRSGEIGELQLMRTNFTFSREASPDDARYQPDQAGGALMDVGCYCVNLARALAGSEPEEARAISHLHPLGVDDYSAGTLKFGDGFLVTFTCGMTVQSDPGTFIAGTEGAIQIERFWFGQDGFTLTRPGSDPEKIDSPAAGPVYALEADAFAAAVCGEAAPWITKADTLGNMRVLDELRRSAGVPVPV